MPDDSILDIRHFKDGGYVAASVPTIPQVASAPEPLAPSAPIVKKSPSTIVAEVVVHAPPANVREESVEDGPGPQDLPEPSARPPSLFYSELPG